LAGIGTPPSLTAGAFRSWRAHPWAAEGDSAQQATDELRDATMTMLCMRLLGSFSLAVDQQPITSVNAARLQSLLAFIRMHDHDPILREQLAYAFWPDSAEAQALNNLRKALHLLRQKLPYFDQFIQVDAKTVQWQRTSESWLDASEFQRVFSLLEPGVALDADNIQQLIQAAGLYQGDLLPHCYDDWIIPHREQLHERFTVMLALLMKVTQQSGDYPAAIRYATERIRQDRLNESTYLDLMRLHLKVGNPGGALQAYQACVAALRSELGVEPTAAIQALRDDIVSGRQFSATNLSKPVPAPRMPLVARASEWQILKSVWQSAQNGGARVVLLTGEAGIGKSLLAEHLRYALSSHATTAHARAYSAEGDVAFSPISAWLENEEIQHHWRQLDQLGLAQLARLLPALQSSQPGLAALTPIVDGWERKTFLDAVSRALLASGRPTLLVLDDLQWCDSDTLDLLRHLIQHNTAAPLLIVCTLRSGELISNTLERWLRDVRVETVFSQLELRPLSRDDSLQLIGTIAPRTLDDRTKDEIAADAEGNPLFIVEITRAESAPAGRRSTNSASTEQRAGARMLPERLRATIEARLASLSPATRVVCSIAAIISRNFGTHLLTASCARNHLSAEAVVNGLDELWARQILRENGAGGYDFTHDRIRDVALSMIAPAQRRYLQGILAETLLQIHAGNTAPVSARIASHFESAGNYAQAALFFQEAAAYAAGLSAMEEQAALLRRGIAALKHLPDTPARDSTLASFLLKLGPALQPIRPGGASEVDHAFLEARELSAPARHDEALFRAQRGLWLQSLQRGIASEAQQHAQANMPVAARIGTRPVMGEAARCLAMALWLQGHLQAARNHMDYAMACMPAAYFLEHKGVFDPAWGSDCINASSLIYWQLGYPDEALRKSIEGLDVNRALQLPYANAVALEFVSLVYAMLDQPINAGKAADELLALSRKYGFLTHAELGRMLKGWALAARGFARKGIPLLREGLDSCISQGALVMLTLYFGLLAQANLRAGRIDAAKAALTAGLRLAEKNGENFWLAELQRLRAECLRVEHTAREDIERAYCLAIATAQAQGARSFELRSALGLAQFWHTQGEVRRARELLVNTTAQFTEGKTAGDLLRATDLLSTWS
jgi:DNA-binding SARP family transcriptional activator